MNSVSVANLVEAINLTVYSGEEYLEEKQITTSDIYRPGLELTGYFEYSGPTFSFGKGSALPGAGAGGFCGASDGGRSGSGHSGQERQAQVCLWPHGKGQGRVLYGKSVRLARRGSQR